VLLLGWAEECDDNETACEVSEQSDQREREGEGERQRDRERDSHSFRPIKHHTA